MGHPQPDLFDADGGDLIMDFYFGGVRDGLDLRSMFDVAGFTGTNPRAAGILGVPQNVVAAAVDDSYFLFQ